jgi:hypothetical protein
LPWMSARPVQSCVGFVDFTDSALTASPWLPGKPPLAIVAAKCCPMPKADSQARIPV